MKILVSGKTKGVVLKSEKPINFLGAVDKKTGIVSAKNHDLFGRPVGGSILVFPSGVGSSVGAYTIYSIQVNNAAPLAMVCTKADLTVATGCALADIPLLIVSDELFASLQTNDEVTVDTDAQTPIMRSSKHSGP